MFECSVSLHLKTPFYLDIHLTVTCNLVFIENAMIVYGLRLSRD